MSNLAKKRWRLLGEILINRKIECKSELAEISVRRFSSFQLFQTERRAVQNNWSGPELISGCCNTKYCIPKHSRAFKAENKQENETVIIGEQTVALCDSVCEECRSIEFGGTVISKADDKCSQQGEPVDSNKSDHVWFTYTSMIFPALSVDIRHLSNSLTLTNLLGFNNTGNVCIWPSEEVLAYYCLKHAEEFRMKSVCELGGGMTCLAIMMLSAYVELKSALATDGNEQSVTNLEEVVVHNKERFLTKNVSSRLLRWDDEKLLTELQGLFDYVICADCLFFDEFYRPLLQAIIALLKPQGRAILFAPSRSGSFDRFVELLEACDLVKIVRISDNYDQLIHSMHQQNLKTGIEFYDESLHYPKLIEFMKL